MLRGHNCSLELVRGVFNPLIRRNLTATSVRCTDDNDRKKVHGVLSWLKDIFKSEVKFQESRNSIHIEIEDTPNGYSRNFYNNIESCSSPEVASNVEKNADAKINSNNSIGYFRWLLRPWSHNFLLVSNKMDTQIRGVANCSPRNTKPPIREPNMPEKQSRKDEKEKKKKKKKPVLRTDSPEDFPDVVSMETGRIVHDDPNVNFRHQWDTKIPKETVQGTQNVHTSQIWSGATNAFTHNATGLNVLMSASDTEKSSTKTESTSQSAKQIEPSVVDETAEPVDKMETEKVLKKASSSSKDTSTGDEDYNIPLGTDFDAEISAWKDLALKSKVPIDIPNKDDLVTETEMSTEFLSIRPEPPEPKLDVQAIPSANEEAMTEEDVEDIPKEVKVNMKKQDVKRTSDVQKIDSKKLHTLQSSDSTSSMALAEDRRSSRESWAWSTMSGLPRLNVVTFSTSSDGYWHRTEKIKDAKDSGATHAGQQNNPQNVDMRNIGNLEEPPIPEQKQTLRNPQPFEANQPAVDSEYRDSLNTVADRNTEFSMQSTRQVDQETEDGRMIRAEKDSRGPEDRHEYSNSFTHFEDDFVPGYESMSLERTQESSTKEDRKQNRQSAEWTDSAAVGKDSEESPSNVDNYVTDGEYIKVPGDPYPYSKQYFEKWRMSTEDIEIGGSFINKQVEEVVEPEAPIGDSRTRQIENQPPTRNMSHDIHLRNQLSRGKGVPK